VLLSTNYGPCGVCGSIGWAQYLGPGDRHSFYAKQKLSLYRALSRLIPFVAYGGAPWGVNPLGYRLRRPLVPHGDVDPQRWKSAIAENLPKT
jgi:hypothetical protein